MKLFFAFYLSLGLNVMQFVFIWSRNDLQSPTPTVHISSGLTDLSPAQTAEDRIQAAFAVMQATGTLRDFLRYTCKRIVRVGGKTTILTELGYQPDYYIEGAYFLCFDEGGVAPKKNDCVVISLGINLDYSFDEAIDSEYGCQIESFDPYIEAERFQALRRASASLQDALTLQVTPRWRFHRIGLVGHIEEERNRSKIGWMTSLDEMLKYTALDSPDLIIDVLKADIEKYEYHYLTHVNMGFMCGRVKQFTLETHSYINNSRLGVDYFFPPNRTFHLLRRLEKCFSLIRRDTRLFTEMNKDVYGNLKTEFQQPVTYKLPLADYTSELDLISQLLHYGELSFVNRRFLVDPLQ